MTGDSLRTATLAALALGLGAGSLGAQSPARVFQSERHAFRVVTVAGGLEHPWGMAFLPGGDILVTERPGRLRIIRKGGLQPEPIAGLPQVWAKGQGGLLDVAIHPKFAANRLVYVSYSKPGLRGATTAVIRGRLEGNRLADSQEILEARAWTRTGAHFGSRLLFDRSGFLFVTVGERGEKEQAQNLGNHQGTILRLHDDGRVPADNPFVDRKGVLPEIYAYGVRSPQGLTQHPVSGELWESEHGPRGGDEINIIQPGRNYGWPVITYGIDYNGQKISDLTAREGMEQPLHYWVPSIATSGIAIYDGDAFPDWKGDVFVGGLAGQQLARVSFRNGKRTGVEQLLLGLHQRIRDVRSGPDGFLYVLTDEPKGALLRLEPAR